MQLKPDWFFLWCFICFLQVKGVSMSVDWNHVLFIPINHSKSWVIGALGGSRACDHLPSYWLISADGLVDSVLLTVQVALASKSNYMLVSLR